MRTISGCIRPAQPKDFLGIAALDRDVWTGAHDRFIPDGEHVWRVWCEYARVWVAEAAELPSGPWEHIAGAVLLFPTVGGELFLHKVFVHPACAGRGLGTRLLETALAEASVPVLLTVDPANARALALYRKLGFTTRADVRGYYRPQEDRLLLVRQPTRPA
ncbi:MAG: GNAT family N-acetyltransferase [Armatimonadota bacterium]